MKPFKTLDSERPCFFESVMPGRVFSGESISPDYDHDEMTIYGSYRPEAVLQALKTEEISAVLKYCNEHNIGRHAPWLRHRPVRRLCAQGTVESSFPPKK